MISELIKALQAGEELKNAETWKNIQASTSGIIAIAGAVFMALSWVGVKLEVTPEQISAIAGGIAGILGVLNTYSTIATSKRVGVQPRNKSTNDEQQHIDP